MRSVAVVGGSLAGLRCAETLRRDGFDGAIHFISQEAHRPYDRPPLSKELLAGKLAPEDIWLVSSEDFAALDLDLRLGVQAVGFDAAGMRLSLDTGEQLTTDGVCLATGARPRQLGDQNLRGVYTLRTLEDALVLREELAGGSGSGAAKRLVVIGAGFIGAEVAASARSLGLEVSMVELLDVPLSRVLGPRMGQVLAELHLEHGVDLRLGVGVDKLVGAADTADTAGTAEDTVRAVALTDGSEIPADVVVVGIGVVPNTEWLEGSGLSLDNGIVCDETLLAAPGVVAAGDVARWPNRRYGEMMRTEHWDNAIEQGMAAARRLMAADGQQQTFEPVGWFWSDQYDHKLQLAGMSNPQGQLEVVHGSTEERRFVALYEKDDRVCGVFGMNSPRQVMRLRQLIVDGVGWQEGLEMAAGLG